MWRDTCRAIASIVSIGLTPSAVGNSEESATYKCPTSHVSPVDFVADALGEAPIRLEQMSKLESNARQADNLP